LNAQFHWKPGEAERLYYGDLCYYFDLYIASIELDANHDWKKFETRVLKSQRQLHSETRAWAEAMKGKVIQMGSVKPQK